jgi:hypothetical protein
MSKITNKNININFNPSVTGSVEVTTTNHSDKETRHFLPDSELMNLSSKPSIKSIIITNKCNSNTEDNNIIYNVYKEMYMNNKLKKVNKSIV